MIRLLIWCKYFGGYFQSVSEKNRHTEVLITSMCDSNSKTRIKNLEKTECLDFFGWCILYYLNSRTCRHGPGGPGDTVTEYVVVLDLKSLISIFKFFSWIIWNAFWFHISVQFCGKYHNFLSWSDSMIEFVSVDCDRLNSFFWIFDNNL
jgi:hypothetical protein